MMAIESAGKEAILPEMPASTVHAIDESRATQVSPPQALGQTVSILRHSDQMHMIWHQAICHDA
jgi:hypothetical protein